MLQDDPVEVTVRSYDAAFENFSEKTRSVATFAGLKEELDRFLQEIKGQQVLDVGFGSGRDTLYFAEHGLEPYSIEMALSFIDSLHGITSAQLFQMDARQLAFAEDTFDGIWCCAVLLHLPREQIAQTLIGFRRVLKSSGVLYLSMKEGEGSEWIQEGNIGLPRYFSYYTSDELRQLIEAAGFSIFYDQVKPHQEGRRTWISFYARKLPDQTAVDGPPANSQ